MLERLQSTLGRWCTYLQERFPLLKNGLLIACFSFSAVSYSALLRGPIEGRTSLQTLGAACIAFLITFLLFLQLRIADEFKDYADDFRYRSYRPVPRGLVSLKELGIVGISSAFIQLGLTLALSPFLAPLLLLVWGYLGLMTKEFFVPAWLKAHAIVYMLSHMVIMPLIAFSATACDWLSAGIAPPRGVVWFAIVSYFVGLVIEIGRKIRAPKDEERGVETYSALWGRHNAVRAWLGAIWMTTLTSLLAALYIRFAPLFTLVLLLLLTAAVFVAWRFWYHPVRQWAKWIDLMSGVWALTIYLFLGVVPVLLREL
ncbi:MAG: UbiA family prenyltransferase [Leptolyngbyaceae cyanobacterium SL_5_9]|nr:UbiA family prenyltransferase [Leptolyngbyaceae cyanobacterium SL_5_9]NJO75306.1 UbiA family prenyltransferase [Leptolyngbyaceae cyanobacterium RM1_406_9]